MDGIVLKKQISRSDIFIKPEIISFSRKFNDKKLIEQSLKLAQADRLYQEAVKYFDKGDFDNFLNAFFDAIHSRYDLEKPVIKRFIRRKLGIINELRNKNGQLESKLHEQAQSM